MRSSAFVAMFAFFSVMLATGCAAKKNPDPGDPRTDRGGGSLGIGEANEALQTIFFDFDTYTVRADQTDKLKRAAEFLKSAGTAVQGVLLEGHADDRGSSDYNFVLGQKRGESVRDALAALGIAPASISVVSYGEEFPVVVGTAEESWAQNRRVEFVLLTENANAESKKRRK